MWRTPLASDMKTVNQPNTWQEAVALGLKMRGFLGHENTMIGAECTEECLEMNPFFVESLMGLPKAWTSILPNGDAEPSETQLSHWLLQMRSTLLRINSRGE